MKTQKDLLLEDLNYLIYCLSETDTLNESLDNITKSSIFTTLHDLRSRMTNPQDLDDFVSKHWQEIEEYSRSSNLNYKQKNVFLRIWDALKYAVSKGFGFIKRHWKKILAILLIIVAIVWFGQTERGIKLGTKLFGAGYGDVANGLKSYGKDVAIATQNIIQKTLSFAKPANSTAKMSLDELRNVKRWRLAPDDLIPQSNVNVALDNNGTIFWTTLADGTSAYSFGDDTTLYVPEYE